MYTNVKRTITNEYQAVEFLYELWKNGEDYHPEDDAHDIIWGGVGQNDLPTSEECDQLNELMHQIYENTDIDPCGILIDLGKAHGEDRLKSEWKLGEKPKQ